MDVITVLVDISSPLTTWEVPISSSSIFFSPTNTKKINIIDILTRVLQASEITHF